MLKRRSGQESGGQELGELVSTVRNTYANAGSWKKFLCHNSACTAWHQRLSFCAPKPLDANRPIRWNHLARARTSRSHGQSHTSQGYLPLVASPCMHSIDMFWWNKHMTRTTIRSTTIHALTHAELLILSPPLAFCLSIRYIPPNTPNTNCTQPPCSGHLSRLKCTCKNKKGTREYTEGSCVAYRCVWPPPLCDSKSVVCICETDRSAYPY
jgi:hypothetical protein